MVRARPRARQCPDISESLSGASQATPWRIRVSFCGASQTASQALRPDVSESLYGASQTASQREGGAAERPHDRPPVDERVVVKLRRPGVPVPSPVRPGVWTVTEPELGEIHLKIETKPQSRQSNENRRGSTVGGCKQAEREREKKRKRHDEVSMLQVSRLSHNVGGSWSVIQPIKKSEDQSIDRDSTTTSACLLVLPVCLIPPVKRSIVSPWGQHAILLKSQSFTQSQCHSTIHQLKVNHDTTTSTGQPSLHKGRLQKKSEEKSDDGCNDYSDDGMIKLNL